MAAAGTPWHGAGCHALTWGGEPKTVHSTDYPGLAGEDATHLATAEERYAAVLAGGEELNLRGLRLTSLPDAIGDCTTLVKLDCSKNRLESLPESIGKCAVLVELRCGRNELAALPDTIGNLIGLKSLDCRGNELAALPDTIGNLIGLKSLDCRNNEISALPENIGACAALQRFICKWNALTELPESLSKCTALEDFECDRNSWDPAWLDTQGLSPGDNPTTESLRAFHARQSTGRMKPARDH